MAGVAQDKTTSRVALCSAIFAGFAYVGYAVVRQTFGKKLDRPGFLRNENDVLGLELDENRNGKVYLRRLSGTDLTLFIFKGTISHSHFDEWLKLSLV